MSQTTRDNLHDTLKDLTDQPLKMFKSKLCDRTLKPRIRQSEVEKADRLDLVNILISRYTENRAVQVTVNILEAMDCNELATELKKIQGEQEVEEGGEREGEEEEYDDDDEDDEYEEGDDDANGEMEKEVEERGERVGEEEERDDDDEDDEYEEGDDDANGEMEGHFTDFHHTGPFERVSNVDEMAVQFHKVTVIHEEIPVVVWPEWNE